MKNIFSEKYFIELCNKVTTHTNMSKMETDIV